MSKPTIELIFSEYEDWWVLRVNSGESFLAEGRSISVDDWVELLEVLGHEVKQKVISDEDMEEGNY